MPRVGFSRGSERSCSGPAFAGSAPPPALRAMKRPRAVRSVLAYGLTLASVASLLAFTTGCGAAGVDDVLMRCGTPMTSSPPEAAPKGPGSNATVLLLRGLINTYSLGLDEL